MKLEKHNIKKTIISALVSGAASIEQGNPVIVIDGVRCSIDSKTHAIRVGEGHFQRWYEIDLRDVTPAKFLPPDEQAARDDNHKDWWMISTSKRTCFVRNRCRSGAIDDFLKHFPGETAPGMDAPDAELARGFEFIDDEASEQTRGEK
jgi:hypothetical protein